MEIIGVVPGLMHDMIDRVLLPHLYVPFGQQYRANMTFHARGSTSGRGAETSALQAIRQEIRAIDDRLPVLELRTLRDHRDASVTLWLLRVGAALFTVFGGLAVFLAVVGIYGVKAYLVSRRTREIGIRTALGATPAAILRLVLREGVVLTLVGLGIGLALAAAIARIVGAWLVEVDPFDPLVFLAAPVLLAAAALLACYIPARRATRIAPVTALRFECLV